MSVLDYLTSNIKDIITYQPGKPIEYVAKELGLAPESIAKLASNENPLGPSPKAIKVMRQAIKGVNIYPDGGAYDLKDKLAEHYNLKPSNFIVGNGSNELLEFIAHCFMSNDTSVIASEYSFIVYKMMAKMFGAEFLEVPAKALGHDISKFHKYIKPNTRVIFVCNPNNPTGTFLNSRQIDAFMKKIPNDVLVVFDEAYAEISQSKMPDTLKYVAERDNVIVLRTFSKAYGLAGLRIGYGIASENLIQALEKPRQPFNTNMLAQVAAVAALDDRAFVNKSKRLFKAGIKEMVEFCEQRNIEYIKPVANFMLIKVGNGQKVFEELQVKGIIVRPMGGYGLNEWIRISFGTETENKKMFIALSEVLNG